MQVQPYLFFDGRCEEAIEFYRGALSAEVTAWSPIASESRGWFSWGLEGRSVLFSSET
jgi:uncharacterized glyoxalase superfamily protein PhnB